MFKKLVVNQVLQWLSLYKSMSKKLDFIFNKDKVHSTDSIHSIFSSLASGSESDSRVEITKSSVEDGEEVIEQGASEGGEGASEDLEGEEEENEDEDDNDDEEENDGEDDNDDEEFEDYESMLESMRNVLGKTSGMFIFNDNIGLILLGYLGYKLTFCCML